MKKITAPIFIALAEHDIELSNEYVKDKAREAPNATVVTYPYGHFEMYHDTAFQEVAMDQVEFLSKHFGISERAS